MTKIVKVRVECPDCGRLVLSSRCLTLRMCVDDGRWSYCFFCPVCHRATMHESAEQVVAQLVANGVAVQRWHLPAELTEARPGGPVLTPDDLLDFHLFLHRADWFADVHLAPGRATRHDLASGRLRHHDR